MWGGTYERVSGESVLWFLCCVLYTYKHSRFGARRLDHQLRGNISIEREQTLGAYQRMTEEANSSEGFEKGVHHDSENNKTCNVLPRSMYFAPVMWVFQMYSSSLTLHTSNARINTKLGHMRRFIYKLFGGLYFISQLTVGGNIVTSKVQG